MSLRLTNIQPIPEETKRVAQSAFPHGNVYMQLRDELGSIYDNAVFADLYSTTGQPGISP